LAQAQAAVGTARSIRRRACLDINYAKRIGSISKTCLSHTGHGGTGAGRLTESWFRSGALDIIVIDSVAALVPKAEIEGDMGDSLPGLQQDFEPGVKKVEPFDIKSQYHCRLHQSDKDEDRGHVRKS